MGWPMSQDYNEAVQSPAHNFADPDLRRGQAAVNALGLPMPCSGNFADVYQVRCPDGSRWAVKCFTRYVAGLRERYQAISKHLRRVQLPFTVEFRYLEGGIRVGGQWFPVLKMQWVEGMSLNQFIAQSVDKPAVLQGLLQIWGDMGQELHAAEVAHGDLQHGNVLLARDASSLSLKLVDYDGAWVPALAGLPSGEAGHPAYQHPERLRGHGYGPHMDRFSLLLVSTALRALQVGGRALWEKYDNGDNVLFRQEDLEAPSKSPLFYELLKSDDPTVRFLAGSLIEAARTPPNQTPLRRDQVSYQRSSSPQKAAQAVAIARSSTAEAARPSPDEAQGVAEPTQAPWENRRTRLLLISVLVVMVPVVLTVGLLLFFAGTAGELKPLKVQPIPDKTEHLKQPARSYWAHGNGAFLNVKDKHWVERIGPDINLFTEIGRTQEYVELRRKTDAVWVRLHSGSCEVKFGAQPYRELYRGGWDTAPRSDRSYWVHRGGSFTEVKDKHWVETIGLDTNLFTEINRTADYVELKRKTAAVWVRLHRDSCEAKFGVQPYKELYRGGWDSGGADVSDSR